MQVCANLRKETKRISSKSPAPVFARATDVDCKSPVTPAKATGAKAAGVASKTPASAKADGVARAAPAQDELKSAQRSSDCHERMQTHLREYQTHSFTPLEPSQPHCSVEAHRTMQAELEGLRQELSALQKGNR
jgi:hypothetical protein